MVVSVPQVLQEIRDGHKLSLGAAARIYGNNPATFFRFCRDGARGADGTRIKLEHVRIGSRIFVSGPACERFIVALSDPGQERPAMRSPAARSRASSAAEKQLVEMGV